MSGTDEDENDLLEEDKYGRLVCRKTRRVYPKGETITKENMEEAFNDESPAVSLSSEVFSEKDSDLSTSKPNASNTSVNTPEPEVFIGGATEKEAEQKIGMWGFVIYYRMPTDNSIQLSLPLMLAYKSSQNGYYHFHISQKSHYENRRKVKRVMFKVECGDFLPFSRSRTRNLIPEFLSLAALVKHYKTFAYLDAEKGMLEIFPLCSLGFKK